MNTLQQDLDDLDRMVDGDTPKDKIRSQIRLISREVAALEEKKESVEENNAALREANTKFDTHLAETKAEFDGKISGMKERDKKELRNWMEQKAKQSEDLRKSYNMKE